MAATRAGVVAEVELEVEVLPVVADVFDSAGLEVDCYDEVEVEVVPPLPVEVLVVVVLTTAVYSSSPSSCETSVTSVVVVVVVTSTLSPPSPSIISCYTSSSSALTPPSAKNPAIKSSVDTLFILFEFNLII